MRARASLQPSQIYHVCSRGNNRESIFLSGHDREHFLDLYARHITLWAETFADCLLHNHFHLLLRFAELPAGAEAAGLPSQRISNMLNAYARSFNADHHRTGALFQRPFRRIPIASQEQLVRVVIYIHLNPVHHELATDFQSWRYSSYGALRAHGTTRLARDEVLAWFGGRMPFAQAHEAALERPVLDGPFLESDSADTT